MSDRNPPCGACHQTLVTSPPDSASQGPKRAAMIVTIYSKEIGFLKNYKTNWNYPLTPAILLAKFADKVYALHDTQ